MTDHDTGPPRRRGLARRSLLLGGGAVLAAGAAAACTAAPPATPTAPAPPTFLPEGKDPRDFVTYGVDPYEVESVRDRLAAAPVTSLALMFVRQNLPLPDPAILDDRAAWSVRVDGVTRPGPLTVADLQRMSPVTVEALIQCAGNGRGFAPHGPSGSPWRVGAVGNARWTGVAVRDVLDRLGGPVDGAAFLTATGAEPLPPGDPLDHVVERSVPLAKGLADCLLAWDMNGQPIPLAHGGPLRLIVPGYWGINQVKFVGRLACTAQETGAAIQRTGYRVRPVGVAADPSQPSMWAMGVKSLIVGPTDRTDLVAGRVDVRGYAWAGEVAVAGVEVSTDGGTTWQAAELGSGAGAASWREFRYPFDAPAGEYRLVSRATDANGAVQPEFPEPNERGYGHNGWRNPALTVTVG